MPTDMAILQELVRWAERNGTTLDGRVEIYLDPTTGLSFRASEAIPPETKLVVSSPRTALSYLNAIDAFATSKHNSPPFPRQFIVGLNTDYPHIIGHFFLMQQYLMGQDSFWWEYIKTLPQPGRPESMCTPMWWPDEDLAFLAGTNAAPGVERKNNFWKSDYDRGIALLHDWILNANEYTFLLYKWASTIFGTRSFRPSLTIQREGLNEFYPMTTVTHPLYLSQVIGHVLNDRFSILFPVLDIGNHNGVNQVKWSTDPDGLFSVASKFWVPGGRQIYNYYGDKPNSELLVGYGFTIPSLAADIVNLKVQPPSDDAMVSKLGFDALALRRSQNCHEALKRHSESEKEWMYHIYMPNDRPAPEGLPELQFFSHGLVNTVSCLVANEGERRFLAAHSDYCLERDTKVFRGEMSRNLIAAFRVLHDKLNFDLQKLRRISASLEPPRNSNQILALDYRNRQSRVFKYALSAIEDRLRALLHYNTFCGHSHRYISRPRYDQAFALMHASVEILFLECAYDWLHRKYPEVLGPLSTFVSKLEEEPDPPNWGVLARDFGNVYWTIWVFIVYMLGGSEDAELNSFHPDLKLWLSTMHRIFLERLDNDEVAGQYGDTQERGTIQQVANFITSMPRFNTACGDEMTKESVKFFATFVAFQQTIVMKVPKIETGEFSLEPNQRVLCITKTPWGEDYVLSGEPGEGGSISGDHST